MTPYLTRADADALAATLAGQVPAYAALVAAEPTDTSGKRAAALLFATLDWDNARRFQGRKFLDTQELEFPRVAYEARAGYPQGGLATSLGGDTIWDWDSDTNTAVVPSAVLMGVLLQADSILSGKRDQRLSAIHDGLSGVVNGVIQETYFAGAEASALCRRADLLAQAYRLKQGKFL